MREAAVGNALSHDGGQPSWRYSCPITANVDDDLSLSLKTVRLYVVKVRHRDIAAL